MAKPHSPPVDITQADLEKYLATADDFRLEMQVFRTCKQNTLHAEHSGTYTDPVTQKDRQFDVRAESRGVAGCNIRLAIECKNLKPSSPLLISRTPREAHEAFHDVILGSHGMPFQRVRRVSGHQGAFRQNENVGRSMAQVRNENGELKGNDKEVYDGWAQAVASGCDYLTGDVVGNFRERPKKSYTVGFPVLAVPDETLWIVDYDATGTQTTKPNQVGETWFYLGKKGPEFLSQEVHTFSHMLIATLGELPAFLCQLKDGGPLYNQLFYVCVDEDARRGT